MATKKREESGSGCCCCGLLTVVVLVALGIGGYIYREQVLGMIYKISHQDEYQTTEEYDYESSVRNIYSTRDYSFGSGDATGEPEFDSTTLRNLYEIDGSDENVPDQESTQKNLPRDPESIEYDDNDPDPTRPDILLEEEYETTETAWETFERDSSTLPPVQNVTKIYEGSGSTTTEYIKSSTVRKLETDDEDYLNGSGSGSGQI